MRTLPYRLTQPRVKETVGIRQTASSKRPLAVRLPPSSRFRKQLIIMLSYVGR